MIMKKFIGSIIATAIAVSSLSMTAAAKVTVEPNFTMHGNQCGKVVVKSTVNRDVYVSIVQNSPDGQYHYYDDVILTADDDPTHEYIIEGKNDVDYTVTIGVAKYSGSQELEVFEDTITVYDTDEKLLQSLSGYKYTYTIDKSETDEITSEITKESEISNDNVLENKSTVYFPIQDRLRGDVNGDGVVNIRDAAAISSSLTRGETLPEYADFNNDGKVNIRDAAAISKYLVTSKLGN